MSPARTARPSGVARPARSAGPARRSAARHPAQLRALVAPARQEIVDVLQAAGPCSVARIAELVGRPADALYHHLRQLLLAGLVVETERRKEGRHAFAVYDLVVDPLHLRYHGPADARDVAAVMASAQRLSWRHFRASLDRGDAVGQGPRRTLWGARSRGWLRPAALRRVNELLAELIATLQGNGDTAGCVPVSLSFLLAPAPPQRRARAAPVAAKSASRHDTPRAASAPPASRASQAARASRASHPSRRTTPPGKGRRS